MPKRKRESNSLVKWIESVNPSDLRAQVSLHIVATDETLMMASNHFANTLVAKTVENTALITKEFAKALLVLVQQAEATYSGSKWDKIPAEEKQTVYSHLTKENYIQVFSPRMKDLTKRLQFIMLGFGGKRIIEHYAKFIHHLESATQLAMLDDKRQNIAPSCSAVTTLCTSAT